MQGVWGLEFFLVCYFLGYLCSDANGQKYHTLHYTEYERIYKSAGFARCAEGCDTTMTLMGLVGHVSQWYKCPT